MISRHRQRVRFLFLWALASLVVSSLMTAVTASPTLLSPSPQQSTISNSNERSHSLPQLHNLLQQQQRRRFQWQTPQQKLRPHHRHSSSIRKECGTRLTWRCPTPESVANWFASMSREFNHDSVGMTNPCLHISLSPSILIHNDEDNDDNPFSDLFVSHTCSSSLPGLSLPQDAGDNVEDSWWPNTSCQDKQAQQQQQQQQQQQPAWKVVRYRRRIGRGQECYERVRNAALDWEFAFGRQQQQSSDSDVALGDDQEMGILAVHPQTNSNKRRSSHHHNDATMSLGLPTSRRDTLSHVGDHDYHQHPGVSAALDGDLYAPLTRDAARHVSQLWSGPGGRRLVTYTRTSGNFLRIPCLPRLFAVNPVMVVYDLIDQRGPGTTYTSTAYATLKGHWLSGEERVTVALRDGMHGDVDVEILSLSRPAPTLVGKLIWPFVGRRQRDFFEQQLEALEQVSRKSKTTSKNHLDQGETSLPYQPQQQVALPLVLDAIR